MMNRRGTQKAGGGSDRKHLTGLESDPTSKSCRSPRGCHEANGRSGMANVKRRNAPIPVAPRLYNIVGSTPAEEIKPLREIRKLGYEYFWVKTFRACPWMEAF
jgi:hypothetical protein